MMSNPRIETRTGLTLIELVIVLAILAPVVVFVLSGTRSIVDTSVGAAVKVGAQRQVIFTMNKLRKELEKARVESVATDGLSVTYRKALDLTGSGLPVDANGTVSWGAVESSGPVAGNSYTLRFVQDEVITEAVMKRDLNTDGDLSDAFDLGHLERVTTSGSTLVMSPSTFLVDAASPTGDLDGDGLADRMFTLGPGRVFEVKLLTRVQVKDSRRGSRFSRLRVFLPNME